MSNLSRLRHRASRSARQAVYSIRQPKINTNHPSYNKLQKRPKTLLEFSLIDADVIILMDIDDIIPEYSNCCGDGTVHNDRFYDIRIHADKIGLIYSKKTKLFMLLAMNDDYSCSVLFENADLYKLPGVSSKIDMDHINPDFIIAEKANRLMNCVYSEIWSYTTNPIFKYSVNELFKK
jgi:hypothetical protein